MMFKLLKYSSLLLSLFSLAVSAEDSKQVEAQRADVHAKLSAFYLGVGKNKEALDEARISQQARPDLPIGYNSLGMVYAELAEDDLAEQNFKLALKMDPNNAAYNTNYGWFLCKKTPAASFDHFMIAVRDPLYKTPEIPYTYAAECAKKMGDFATAETYYLRANRRNPDMAEPIYGLADMRYKAKDYAASAEYLQKLSEMNVDSPLIYWLAVKVYRKLDKQDALQAAATRLLRLYPNSREAGMYQRGVEDE
ncbi:tetratricopeptide repeat protein [Leeia sp. TBRC 13508]|uniref:Tetratricopeptide repeat protein n=1 Tax=Leeia speluncae TaxID=2884804 RepID=A0ABS8DAN6_9NEIS|nr:tetratricopeptide repeat protein [Leeia speluncae]MCB6185271.1 tetratricopeptide repeat protein [Leeia speluncae]